MTSCRQGRFALNIRHAGMMKKLLSLLLILGLAPSGTALAKIDINWSHATVKVSPQRRQQVERLVHETAALFLDESYADLGKFDFKGHERTVLVEIRDFGANEELGLQLSGVVYINQLRLANFDELRVVLVHEFTHLYDFCALAEMTIEYVFSAESGDARVAEKRLDGPLRAVERIKYAAEQRAQAKAAQYAQKHGLKIPGDIE